jgi:hypothetical protein
MKKRLLTCALAGGQGGVGKSGEEPEGGMSGGVVQVRELYFQTSIVSFPDSLP